MSIHAHSVPDIVPVDMVPPAPSESKVGARFIRANLDDYGQVVALLSELDSGYRGIDAVIHLSAIPAPAAAVSYCRHSHR